jgi:hypothetical protein
MIAEIYGDFKSVCTPPKRGTKMACVLSGASASSAGRSIVLRGDVA